MIKIMNLRTHQCINKHEWHVKVDRSSVLGNPFLEYKSNRDTVCDEYEKYFHATLYHRRRPEFEEELNRLKAIHKKHGKLSLFCWCTPLRCHAETIKAWIEEQ